MRPLPTGKTHGVIHTADVKQADLDKIADALKIPAHEKKWLRPGNVHLVREAKPEELPDLPRSHVQNVDDRPSNQYQWQSEPHSDAVTAGSESLRQQTEETFQLREQIQIIPNFFRPTAPTKSREEVRRDLGISDEFLVVHMSNLRPVKRIDLLLQVIARTSNRDRTRLLILAGGPFAPYESLLDELGLRGHVIVREDAAVVENYLPAADAGLYTSENESFGLSILETLFFGKPVVAFRIGALPEIVEDGVTGILSSPVSVVSLIDGIERAVKLLQPLVEDLGFPRLGPGLPAKAAGTQPPHHGCGLSKQ